MSTSILRNPFRSFFLFSLLSFYHCLLSGRYDLFFFVLFVTGIQLILLHLLRAYVVSSVSIISYSYIMCIWWTGTLWFRSSLILPELGDVLESNCVFCLFFPEVFFSVCRTCPVTTDCTIGRWSRNWLIHTAQVDKYRKPTSVCTNIITHAYFSLTMSSTGCGVTSSLRLWKEAPRGRVRYSECQGQNGRRFGVAAIRPYLSSDSEGQVGTIPATAWGPRVLYTWQLQFMRIVDIRDADRWCIRACRNRGRSREGESHNFLQVYLLIQKSPWLAAGIRERGKPQKCSTWARWKCDISGTWKWLEF